MPNFSSFNNILGNTLAILGAATGLCGAIANATKHYHIGFGIWLFTNALLAAWALGASRSWWKCGLSTEALAVLYGAYEITSAVGFMETV